MDKADARPGLSAQQVKFAQEYAAGGNGTKAAVAAGYAENSAAQQASRLLRNDKVAAYVQELQDEAAKLAAVTLASLVQRLLPLTSSSMGKFATWDGSSVTLKSSADLTADDLACVQEVAQTQAGVKLKLYDRRAAIELVAKLLGFLREQDDSKKPIGDIVINWGTPPEAP